MKKINTYYIKRNNAYIWLGQNIEPLETDEVIEVRPLVIADEGKVLVDRKREIVGNCIWNKENKRYSEIDAPEEVEETDENIEVEDTIE